MGHGAKLANRSPIFASRAAYAMTQDLQLGIDLQGMEDVIGDVETFPQSVGHELSLAMEQSLQLLEGQVADRTPVGVSGNLRSSISHQILTGFPNLTGAVFSPLPYAIVMEEGRKPGAKMPPVAAIALWLYRKGIVTDRKEIRGAAWAVAKSIAKKGIEGKHMFKEGLEASEPHINQLFNSAIARSVARFNQS